MNEDSMDEDESPEPKLGGSGWLTGQLLVAMPSMPDWRFSRAVIYVCSHGASGAMGLVVNRLFGEADFRMLLEQLNIQITAQTPDLPVHYGGPVESGRGFVLHSADYKQEGTVAIDDRISLTSTTEILQAIAAGQGPEKIMMALGYAGWGAGQLDAEMKANGWITVAADDDLVFGRDIDGTWERALSRIGISPIMLSGEAGHA